MSEPWATVVIAVHNTQRWLPAALASLDAQRCREHVAVVIVDDGSTDTSAQIIDAYAQRAPAVTVIHQANAGLGAARNRAIALATGRYLAFLDSDDLYAAGGLDRLLGLADRHEAQIVVGDMPGLPPRPSPPWRRELITGERLITSVARAPDLIGNPSACNKVFRRDLVTAAGGRFSEGTAFEDVLFTIPLLLRATSMVLTPDPVYLYRSRPDASSIMDSRDRPERIFQHLSVIEELAAGLGGCDERQRDAVLRWIVYMQTAYARRAASALDDALLAEFTARVAALFVPVDVATVAAHTSDLAGGLRALGLLVNDPVLVRDPRTNTGLRVVGRRIVVRWPRSSAAEPSTSGPSTIPPGLDGELPERLEPLLETGLMPVTITAVRRDEAAADTVVVHGRWHAPGIAATAGDVRADVLVEIGDAAVRRPIEIVAGDEVGVSPALRFVCRLPMPSGLHGPQRLRVVVRDDGAEATLGPVRVQLGARPTRLGRRWIWVEPGRAAARLVVTSTPLTIGARAVIWAVLRAGRHVLAAVRRLRLVA